ncbi:MAG TPA: hypothetical protein VJ714_10605 [Anaerolineae bacterium]|nr:hypothetical protein [Anaerolineae bacterium]
MQEQPEVQAVRLEIRDRKLRVEPLSNGGSASDEASSNWGCLYVISHVINRRPSTERLLERVEGVAQESYRRSPGGVTNRLRQAVRNANRYLYLRNCVRGEEEAVLASLACVAVRGTDAYACGVGPHTILVLSRGRVRGLDASMSPLDEDDGDGWRGNGHLLGQSATVADPRFLYRQVMPGDQLLVVASDSVESFSRAVGQLKGVLREQDIEVAGEALGELVKKETDGAALLLRLHSNYVWPPFPQEAMETRVAGPPSRSRGMLSSFRQRVKSARTAEPQLSATVETADLRASEPETGARRESRPKLVRHRPENARMHASGAGAGSARATRVMDDGLERCRLAGALLVSLLLALRGAALDTFLAVAGWTRRLWRWSRQHRLLERLGKGGQVALVGLFAGLKGLLIGILPERQRPTTTYAATARPMARAKVLGFHPSGRSRAVIGGLIVLVVFALMGTSAVRVRSRLQQAEVERLAEEVTERLALADQQEDRESTMAALEQAEGLLNGATDIQRESPALAQLYLELGARRDGLTGVVRLPFSMELSAQEPEQGVGNLVIRQDYAYVLDATGQGVRRYHLDDEGHFLLDEEPFSWELPDAMKKQSDARILDMAWVDPENGRLAPALLMLTSDGSVLEMRLDGAVRAVEVADLTAWQQPRALATYSGNLYVLDPGHGNIFKYVPDGDDYQHAPMDYIQAQVDISWSQVVDLAIDGNVYLLVSDGSVMKFSGGQPKPFSQETLPQALASAASIFAESDHQSVLVADPQQGRLVEFTEEGQFVLQYRAAVDGEDYLAELRTFALDVSHNRLFVATPSGLVSASLSALRQQDTE